jgi:biopolymer transport protein ExbD
VIRGDGEVKYETVMSVMTSLQIAGASDIGLISSPISPK